MAAGELDAYFERETKPWDHAAGSLIVREAGGIVGGLGGNAEGGPMLLAANKALFPHVENILNS